MYLPSTPPFILIFQSKIRALQDAVKRNDLSFIAKNSGEVRLLQGEPISSVRGSSWQVSVHILEDPTNLHD